MLWSLAGLAGLLVVLALGVVVVGRVLYRPRVWREPIRDVLILAAHQDDCVVMAGEYAIAAAETGRTVAILYLTNGDSRETNADSDRARKRNAEAIAAWGSIGVQRERICFLGMPAAPISGPSKITAEQIRIAKSRILQSIQELPRESAVFLPAVAESHVDHRTLRQIALEALRECGRNDLQIFEAPEYNAYISLARMPQKTLIAILAGIPLVRRWAGTMRSRMAAPEEFASGGAAWVMPVDQCRIQIKRRMLEMFESEDGNRLVRMFGGRGRVRKIQNIEAALAERPRGYVPIGGYRIGML
jgi:LmbE family N-acetylglucosaminyl deacetylase